MRAAARSLWLGIGLALAGCVFHPAGDPVAPTTAAANELVCRREGQTGTRFKKERCRSQSDLAREVRRSRETIREIDRNSANGHDATLLPAEGGAPR
jgi:exonuclease VII large subunit